jgi:hypothetical protein
MISSERYTRLGISQPHGGLGVGLVGCEMPLRRACIERCFMVHDIDSKIGGTLVPRLVST